MSSLVEMRERVRVGRRNRVLSVAEACESSEALDVARGRCNTSLAGGFPMLFVCAVRRDEELNKRYGGADCDMGSHTTAGAFVVSPDLLLLPTDRSRSMRELGSCRVLIN